MYIFIKTVENEELLKAKSPLSYPILLGIIPEFEPNLNSHLHLFTICILCSFIKKQILDKVKIESHFKIISSYNYKFGAFPPFIGGGLADFR